MYVTQKAKSLKLSHTLFSDNKKGMHITHSEVAMNKNNVTMNLKFCHQKAL